jgi:hypothetical protein
MKSTEHFKNTIREYLDKTAAEDAHFAAAYAKPDKNMDDCMDFKNKIKDLLKSTGKPCLRLTVRRSKYGKTAFIYFGQPHLTMAIDEDTFGIDVPIEDLKIFIGRSSDVMTWLLEKRYGKCWGKYVRVVYP